MFDASDTMKVQFNIILSSLGKKEWALEMAKLHHS